MQKNYCDKHLFVTNGMWNQLKKKKIVLESSSRTRAVTNQPLWNPYKRLNMLPKQDNNNGKMQLIGDK